MLASSRSPIVAFDRAMAIPALRLGPSSSIKIEAVPVEPSRPTDVTMRFCKEMPELAKSLVASLGQRYLDQDLARKRVQNQHLLGICLEKIELAVAHAHDFRICIR